MKRPRRILIAALTATALVVAVAPSAATEGNLYPYGASIWSTSGQFGATVLPGPEWLVQGPALSPAADVNHWEMNWGCPVPGSEIAVVRFSALRTQAPSSMAIEVTGDRRVLWSEGDAAMPQSPAGGRAYSVGLPGGQCNVHLALRQVERRNQHARGYFIDGPGVLVRDVTAPGVALRALSGGWLNAGSRMRVEWTAADNFGADGMGPQRVVVAGQPRWSGAPGAGDHAVELPLDGLPDGTHAVAVEVDGDGTAGGAAHGTVHIDRTPPSASGATATAPGAPGVVAASWTAADDLSGVAAGALELNAAPDGSTAGAWTQVGPAGGAGPRSVSARAAGIADGLHAWRVRTTDVAGNTGVAAGAAGVVVDTTPPALEVHGGGAGWLRRAEIDLTVTDNLQSELGVGPVEIDVNAAADGGDGGIWLRRAASAGSAGRRVVPIDLSGLAAGRHAVRIVARNGGAFGASLAAERRVVLSVDAVRPSIARLTASAGADGQLAVAWTADDEHSGVAAARLQWRDGDAWRTLAATPSRDGADALSVDASALPPGERALRLVITDRAGNEATRGESVRLAAGATAAGAPDPAARLRSARLRVAVQGARAVRRDGRTLLVRRLTAGGAVRITGTLTDRGGQPIAGADVQARGHRGRVVARALTGARGGFALLARPLAGGPLRIGVPVGRELLPERPGADVRLDVRPRLSVAASATGVAVGGRVLFTGRITPAPRALGYGARKGVVLEWLDPIRRTWRPVVNARVRRDGTFAIPWSFAVGGLTHPMRVTVPTEVGWPLQQARSPVIRVRVS
ncbi:carboxypeptidase-like regulatory domain-containing protein [Miltoncostaea marina]|uniref:carboxypeptidase-like regulatory domain-containing protein n=1 Tax=Miltoncostaea marina TaxID=2843215 RepID=UPI001C3DF693|nr:carboxypeptidase-like regulatory domain-containing protein [Miltoncostaea marina]